MTKKLSADIWVLGFVSMLMDVSSETIYGILPVFLVSTLGIGIGAIGFLEGVSEAMALLFKVISGPMSDWMNRRKPLVVLGYGMGALSKPFFALASSYSMVFAARVFDRIGKGIRGAPRDALLADIAPVELRGSAFGLRQALDTTGAFLGPLLAIFLLHLTNKNFRMIFWLAAIPALFSVVVLIFGIHEKQQVLNSSSKKKISLRAIQNFRLSFWVVVGSGALFQLARFSVAFLILRGKDLGLAIEYSPLILIIMNAVYATSSYPVGLLSDKIRREYFLIMGLGVLIVADIILAYSTTLFEGFIGIGLWGLHMGLTQGTLNALVADNCPPELRGTAFGLFNVFSALALLLASTIAGFLWENVGPQMTFLAGASFSFLSLSLILAFKIFHSKH